MRTLSYDRIFKLSFQRSKDFLFGVQFSWKRWLKILFIVMTAGQLGGGCLNMDMSGLMELADQESADQESADVVDDAGQESGEEQPLPSEEKIQRSPRQVLEEMKSAWKDFKKDFRENRPLQWAVWSILGMILLLILVGTWFFARFNFIWFHALTTGEVTIRAPFKDYQNESESYFRFAMVFSFVILVLSLGIFVWLLFEIFRVASATGSDAGKWSIFVNLMGPLAVFLLFALLLNLLWFYVNHMVVSLMGFDRTTVRPAIEKFLTLFRDNSVDMLIAPVLFLGIAIAGGVLVLILGLAILLVGLLIATIIGGLLYFVFQLLSVQYVATVILWILGIVWVVFLLVIFLCGQIPLAVFMRYFTLYFLASLKGAVDLKRFPISGFEVDPEHS